MQKQLIRRYTNLPSLIDILTNNRLTLLNPNTWDDGNDSYFINIYKSKVKLKSVLALCFTGNSETYHHWKIFSDGPSGVCILFNKEKLLSYLEENNEELEYNNVRYKKIKDLENENITLSQMPYVKRLPYKDEKEFRIIYKNIDDDESLYFKHFNIQLDCIERIILSPWIPEPLFKSLKMTIKKLNTSPVKVYRTTLISNDQWKNIGKKMSAQ